MKFSIVTETFKNQDGTTRVVVSYYMDGELYNREEYEEEEDMESFGKLDNRNKDTDEDEESSIPGHDFFEDEEDFESTRGGDFMPNIEDEEQGVRCRDCESVDISGWGYPSKGNGRCKDCNGTGNDHDIAAAITLVTFGLARVNEQCRRCSGTGQCQTCGGTGLVYR